MPYNPMFGTYDSEEEARANGASGGAWVSWTDPETGEMVSGFQPDNSSGGASNPYAGEGLEDWQNDLAGTPILGWLTGADAALANAKQMRADAERQRMLDELRATMPSEDDLSVEYGLEGTGDEYGDLLGGQSRLEGMNQRAQERALRQLQGISDRGGYTAADLAQQRAGELARGQQMGSANAAVMQQMQARGMGGSGAQLAAMFGNAQGANMGNAMAGAQIQSAAMQRALQAMQAQGSLASTMQSQEMQRRQALDDYNSRQLDWRRGRESRNTAYDNRSRESAAEAAQQAYANRRDVATIADNQWVGAQGTAQRNLENQNEANEDLGAFIGNAAELIF